MNNQKISEKQFLFLASKYGISYSNEWDTGFVEEVLTLSMGRATRYGNYGSPSTIEFNRLEKGPMHTEKPELGYGWMPKL